MAREFLRRKGLSMGGLSEGEVGESALKHALLIYISCFFGADLGAVFEFMNRPPLRAATEKVTCK